MRLLWEEEAWEDYCLWQTRDKKLLKRINSLIKDIQRNTYEGIGKPEPLKGDLSGWWSRRIDDTHRIVTGSRMETSSLRPVTVITRIPEKQKDCCRPTAVFLYYALW